MTFSVFWPLVFASVASSQVLNRIQSQSLPFANEVCGNLTALSGQFENCANVDFSTVPNDPCIPPGQANCLVRGLETAFTNFTSDDVEVPFNWICSADKACGIATLDVNSTNAALGTLNGSTTFGVTNRVVGFIEFDDNGAKSFTRKIRQNGVLVIDKRVEYVFSFDFCFANATLVDQKVTLYVHIANAAAIIFDSFLTKSVIVPANAVQSTCGRLVARIPHYELFPHVGINGFAVEIENAGDKRLYVDNVLVQALPVISNDEGDTCQFAPAVVSTVVPAGTPLCTRVFINEINYRNVTFTGMQITPTEAIEIAGPAGTDLTNMKIVLVNFDANGVPQQTSIVMGAQQGIVTIPESPESPGFGFLTVAFSQGLPDGTDGIGIDGVALFQRSTDTVPIQFVCFGTNASAANLPNVPFPCSTVVDLNGLAVNDTSDPGSVHLVGCGNCYQDFDWDFSDPATIVNATAGLPFQNTRQQFVRDQDNDGYWDDQFCGGNDCNDLVSFIFPGAVEICDGEQTNCIGPAVSELDADGDGRLACDGDCNDADNTTFGLAQFFVNGSIAVGGQIATAATGCRAVPLAVNNSQLELCDLIDNDCDGLVNEAFVSLFHFRDNDFDGFADVNADDRDTAEFPNCQVFDGCNVSFPRGWSPNRTDCDDSNPNVHPDGNRFCRLNDTCELTGTAPLDNNCNGVFDELDVIDVDGDGFANATASANATLCPLRATAFACRSAEVQANGDFETSTLDSWSQVLVADDSASWQTYQAAATVNGVLSIDFPDAEGAAGAVVVMSGNIAPVFLFQNFTVPSGAASVVVNFLGFVIYDGQITMTDHHARVDILKANANVGSIAPADVLLNLFISSESTSTGAFVAHSVDITSAVSAGGVFALRFGAVATLESLGFAVDNVTIVVQACGDCNDRVRAINPNATELCNKLDDNCNFLIDEDLFIDRDGDGFGTTASHPNCTAFYPLTDCDDRNDTTLSKRPLGSFSHPGLIELLCDGLNNDCSAATPDSRAETCDQIDTDCNCGLYNDPTVAFVSTCNGTNENVTRLDNGIVNDTDTDGAYAFPAAFRTQCLAAGYIFDCNDTNTAFPSAEVCDGLDNDCDLVVDEDFFADSDGDLWPDFAVNATLCGARYNTTADCAPFNADINPGVNETASDALFCNNFDDDCNNQTGPGSNGGAGALEENSTLAILFDGDNDGFRNLTDATRARCAAIVTSDEFLNQPLDCNDSDPARHPCRLDEFVCLTRIGGVKPLPCGADEHYVCGRELTVNDDGVIVGDGLDNDCNGKTDDLVDSAVHFVLSGEFFDAAEATDDDDDDSSSSSSSSSSKSKPDQFCADIKVTLWNDAKFDVKDVVIKGQLTLPPKGQLTEYVFGDLENFGIKVDTRTLRVAWVQFKLEKQAKQEVVFPVCVRRRDYIGGVQLSLQLVDYSLSFAEGAEPVPLPLNLQTTVASSTVTVVAFP